MAPGELQVRQGDLHLMVAMAQLVAHAMLETMLGGGRLDPLQRLGIRADQQRIGMPFGDQSRQRRGRAKGDRIGQRHRLLQGGDAVQVRVDGDQCVELAGQQLADHSLADHLARVEGDVLAHVGQIGRDQDQSLGAQAARFTGHQQQLDQLFVGVVEAAVEHQLLGDRFAFGQRQAQAQLVIGKTVALD